MIEITSDLTHELVISGGKLAPKPTLEQRVKRLEDAVNLMHDIDGLLLNVHSKRLTALEDDIAALRREVTSRH